MNKRATAVLVCVFFVVFIGISLFLGNERAVQSPTGNQIAENSNTTPSTASEAPTPSQTPETPIAEPEAKDPNEIVFYKSTEHFEFYCVEKDHAAVDEIADILESAYDDVLNKLQTELDYIVTVKVYPDIEAYHKIGLGNPKAEQWMVGTARNKMIQMTSPNNPGDVHDYYGVIQVSVHELVHLAVNKASEGGLIPLVLGEGIATYMTGQNSGVSQLMEDCITANTFPYILEMTSTDGLYQYGYALTEFIVEEYGYDGLIALIKNSNDTKIALNLEGDEFQKAWEEYITKTYE